MQNIRNKCIYILLILTCSSVLYCQEALTENVNEEFENDQLEFILKTLDRKYDISIRYNKSLLPLKNNSYAFHDIAMADVLNIILKDNFEYVEYDQDKIIIVPKSVIKQEEKNTALNVRAPIAATPVASNIKIGIKDSSPGPYVINGSLVDNKENIPIDNALILDKTSGTFTYSNANGYYSITLSSGIHDINISSLSHENYNQVVDVVGSGDWNVKIPYKSYYIEDITVSAVSKNYKIKETISGLEELSTSQIKQLNSFMGENDVIKSLMTIAGVSNIGEGSSGFNVRGGNIDQNLILKDDAIILNPSHILGFFSIFNADIISTTSLYKGHIPASFGGRSSSVLDINLREADFEKIKVKGSLGLISSKVTADLPIIKGKSSLLVSGRASYVNWWLRGVDNLDLQRSDALFNDTNLKYTHKFSSKTKLIGSYFRSFDELQFSDEFGYSWSNEVGNVQLKHIINNSMSVTAKFVSGRLSNHQFVPVGPLAFDLSSGMNYNQIGVNGIYNSDQHNITAGLEYIIQNTKPEILQPINGSQSVNEQVQKERGNEFSFYLNDQWSITDQIGLDLGIRFNTFSQIGPAIVNTYLNDNFFSIETIQESTIINSNENIVSYHNIEPRLSLRYNINGASSLKLSYNRTVQNLHLLSNATTPTPIDIWQVSNTHIRPLLSDNYSIGLYHNLTDDLQITIEGFYKSLSNVIEYKDFAQLTLNPNLETAILIGDGRAFGTEITLNKSGKKVSGRLNYSFSRSQRKTNRTNIETINNGEWFPSNFDTPHEVKLFLNWQVSKRDRFNINFILRTGRPITAPQSNFILQGVVISDFSKRNAIRLPDYHRLDFSYTLRLNKRTQTRYKSNLTVSFYNVYGRRNPFSVFFRQALGSSINALQLSVIGTVIPSVTYDFSF